MNALSISDLHVKINESHILHGVTFDVPAHKVTALLGRNGVGKSTTLKGILGLYPGTGSVKLNGREIIGVPTYKIVQSGIAYVPEDREIFSSLSPRYWFSGAVFHRKRPVSLDHKPALQTTR